MLRWFRRQTTPTTPTAPPSHEHTTPLRQEGGAEQPYIREAERRRLRRLLQRQAELRYDVEQAHEAQQPVNRWTARVAELEAAIAQAEADLKSWEPPVAPAVPPPLPALPIRLLSCQVATPATVSLAIATTTCTWYEEIDWAERGHQLAPSRLVRDPVDLTPLLPPTLSERQRTALLERLSASLDLLAADTLQAGREGREITLPTLATLVRPCSVCGGWRDLHDHCPDCIARERHRQQLFGELQRLRKERAAILADMARIRDRLPVIERQLREVETEIAALQAKGVTPET